MMKRVIVAMIGAACLLGGSVLGAAAADPPLPPGAALKDGKIKSLDDPVTLYIPN
jgi:hypothetical protein